MKRYRWIALLLASCDGNNSAKAPSVELLIDASASGGAFGDASTSGAGGASSQGGGGKGAARGAGGSQQVPPDPCIASGTCPPGKWVSVTPAGVDLSTAFTCGNYGTESVQVDPMNPSNVYTQFNCQGVWKSTDYGFTWKGPINTGSGKAAVTDTAGGITIPANGTTEPPVIFSVGIRGAGTGFWKSTNGGVDWTNYVVTPTPSRQDYYPPDVDPSDPNHLLMSGHEMDSLVESTDGGQTWSAITTDPRMASSGGTDAIFFIDTGTPATTRTTWLWTAQQAGGALGTWRTTDGGKTWTQVDKNEHPHGTSQIYQPDSSGVVYMAGAYSDLGWGVLRSTDYGATWAHVGATANLTVVFGTKKSVYSMYGYPIGAGSKTDPILELVPQPGTGTWTNAPTPSTMQQGPGHVAVLFDGTHSVALAACYNGGLWRYVEP